MKQDINSDSLKNYKWLVSSALQKSIRRGREDLAKNYVHFLWSIDRSYLCYRLGTILCEDVGVANIDLVSEYLQTKGAKKAIDERGGEDFIQRIVQDACQSIKDRSSCDSAYLVGFLENKFSTMSKDDIKAYYEQSTDYKTRINALWLLLGNKRFKNDSWSFFDTYLLNEKGVVQDDVPKVLGLISDEKMKEVFKNAYDTQRENISLGMPVMFDAYKSEAKNDERVGQVVKKRLLNEFTVKEPVTGLDILNVAIDGHTAEGKGIYYDLLKQREFKNIMDSYRIDEEYRMNILKHLIFRVEGHEVNKRVYYPTAVSVMKDCEQIPLSYKSGVFDESFKFDVLKDMTIKMIDVLNERRSGVFKKVNNSFKKGF